MDAIAQTNKDSMPVVSNPSLKYMLLKPKRIRKIFSQPENRQKGLPSLGFSGVVDFIAFYRTMQQTYPGISTPEKNLEFTPYPAGSQFNGNFYRQPLVDLIITGNPSANISFAFEYAFSHFFTGRAGDTSRKINIQNLLQFHGSTNTKYGNFFLSAGGGAISYSVSPFTMYNKDFREPMFEKLPWDWYTNSFQKYKTQFASSATTTPSYLINTATQGFILEGTDLPGHLGFSGFYGRSSLSTTPDKADAGVPSEILAGKVVWSPDTAVKFAANIYHAFGFTDRVHLRKDQRNILTASIHFKKQKFKAEVEVGEGQTINPQSQGNMGLAARTTFLLHNAKIKMPVMVMAYSISPQVVSLESAVLNANPTVIQGGYGADSTYDNSRYSGFLQEVGMMANNRSGIQLRVDKIFRNFQIEFATAISAEQSHINNLISFEHMVNAFPRSRFQPWVQGAGPYHRVGNRFRRSIETLKVTGQAGLSIKKFNASEASLKWKTVIGKRELLLVSYSYGGSIQDKLSFIPVMNSGSFLYSFYEEFSAYYNLFSRLTLIGFSGFQTNQANDQTALSTENGKPLSQYGTALGFGIDYDFDQNAGIFLRHRWMKHRDKNFTLDHFQGQETTLELKIFF